MNVVASSVKYYTANLCPIFIKNELKSIYNSPFKDSHAHPIHTYFPTITSYVKFTDLI